MPLKWLLFYKSVTFEILMNVSLSVIPEDGGTVSSWNYVAVC